MDCARRNRGRRVDAYKDAGLPLLATFKDEEWAVVVGSRVGHARTPLSRQNQQRSNHLR